MYIMYILPFVILYLYYTVAGPTAAAGHNISIPSIAVEGYVASCLPLPVMLLRTPAPPPPSVVSAHQAYCNYYGFVLLSSRRVII